MDNGSIEASSSDDLEGEQCMDSLVPVDVFEKLLTPDIVSRIWKKTNCYGEQYIDHHIDHLAANPRARAHNFVQRQFSLVEIYR